jgi:hypothetical protein
MVASGFEPRFRPFGELVTADGVTPAHVVTADAVEKVWQFPDHRFVEYEPKDETWARPLGYGREVDRPAIFKGDRYWFVHPDLVGPFRAAFEKSHAALEAVRRERHELRSTLTRFLNW